MAAGRTTVPEWVRTSVRLRRADPPVGHSIRAGLCVGVPVSLGLAADEVAVGATVALACVLRSIGEHDGPHRVNARNVLIATPIVACGYLTGALQDLALVPLVALMAAAAFVAGTLGRHGEAFALAGMQVLLIASIALGVPDPDVAETIVLFVAGAALYSAAMAVDYLLIEPRRPEQRALAALDAAVGDLGREPSPQTRARANAALAAARRIPSPGWEASEAGIARWGAYGDVVAAADDLVAWEGAAGVADDARRATYAAARQAWADQRPSARRPVRRPPEPSPPLRERLALDHATTSRSARLALCMAIAVSSRAWIDLDHWYWVPATVALVMQPDFGSVFGRAVLRAVGTVVGAGIAAVVLALVPDSVATGVVIGLLAAAIPWSKLSSYVLQSVTTGAVVLLLVEQLAPSGGPWDLPFERGVTTAIGGAIVLVFGYLLWPAARRVAIAPALAGATSSLGELLRTASTPVPADDRGRAERKATAISARQRAFDQLAGTRVPLARAAGEPPPASTDAAAWSLAVDALERLGSAVSDHAIARLAGTPPLPDASEVASSIEALGGTEAPDAVQADATRLAARLTRPGSMSGS